MSRLSPLIDLQAIDQQMRDVQRVVDDIPLRKDKEARRLDELREQLETAGAQLKQAKATVDQAELEVSSLREKITKLRQQQMALKTNKEFKAMEIEIATLEQAIDRQESAQLSAMERLEPEQKQLQECQRRLDEEQTVITAYQDDLDVQLQDARKRLEQLAQQRDALVGTVEPDLYEVYQRLSAGKWPVLVKVVGDSCGGCHMTQPPSTKHLARMRDGTAHCQFCGRMLYD